MSSASFQKKGPLSAKRHESPAAEEFGITRASENIDPRSASASEPSLAARPHTEPQLWYDTELFSREDTDKSLLTRISNTSYTGVMLHYSNLDSYSAAIPSRLLKIIHLNDEQEFVELVEGEILSDVAPDAFERCVISSYDLHVLQLANERKLDTCLRASVTSAETLQTAIQLAARYSYLLLSFKDPTNIPLELAIASLQHLRTSLIKEIRDHQDIHDAVVSLGVMEVGADGVMFSPSDHATLDAFLVQLEEARTQTIKVEVGTVTRSEPVGMGHRACVDLVTMFSEQEGILVGSTSQGGILCCPEVFPLPYMDLRPFRVNAGGIHSYIYGPDGRTNYLSELRAGAPAMVVSIEGKVRRSVVGRIKIEVRPLRFIEVEFSGERRVNVFMQDDWHVRVFSETGLPCNITALKAGDKVLGFVTSPGRHVGIKIDETIIET